ncbi:hypothetical protein [Mesorhizobium abyssinicae]|uniref:hypothetical protein n=1 Tax=Mesorhizobium abyssinicae TaxID=1209958 RepID=UPI003390F070
MQPYYYGTDNIGSVRRAFASVSTAPAYDYDPFGQSLQGTPASEIHRGRSDHGNADVAPGFEVADELDGVPNIAEQPSWRSDHGRRIN